MEIQTFEIEESVDGTTPECEAGAIELIEKLELKGQKSLVCKDGEKRFPYPEMTRQELHVYGAIFPAHTKVEEYSAGIIPIRVLQVVSHAKGYCDAIEVWHKSVRDPDPLLVGQVDAKSPHGHPIRKSYMLARWGDALKQFSELVVEAREIVRGQFRSTLQEGIAKRQAELAAVDETVEKHLRGETVYVF